MDRIITDFVAINRIIIDFMAICNNCYNTWKKQIFQKYKKWNELTYLLTFFWHIFWYSFWHILWHSFWHIFWRSFGHFFWHSLCWAVFLSFFLPPPPLPPPPPGAPPPTRTPHPPESTAVPTPSGSLWSATKSSPVGKVGGTTTGNKRKEERERERKRNRKKEREKESERERGTKRERERQKEKETDKDGEREREREARKKEKEKKQRQRKRKGEKDKDRRRETDRQRGRRTQRERERERRRRRRRQTTNPATTKKKGGPISVARGLRCYHFKADTVWLGFLTFAMHRHRKFQYAQGIYVVLACEWFGFGCVGVKSPKSPNIPKPVGLRYSRSEYHGSRLWMQHSHIHRIPSKSMIFPNPSGTRYACQ